MSLSPLLTHRRTSSGLSRVDQEPALGYMYAMQRGRLQIKLWFLAERNQKGTRFAKKFSALLTSQLPTLMSVTFYVHSDFVPAMNYVRFSQLILNIANYDLQINFTILVQVFRKPGATKILCIYVNHWEMYI